MSFLGSVGNGATIVPWAADLTGTLLAALAVLGRRLVACCQLASALARPLRPTSVPFGSAVGRTFTAQVRELFTGIAVVDRLSVMSVVLALSIGLWGSSSSLTGAEPAAVWPSVSLRGCGFYGWCCGAQFRSCLWRPAALACSTRLLYCAILVRRAGGAGTAFAIVAHVFQLGSVLVLAVVASSASALASVR